MVCPHVIAIHRPGGSTAVAHGHRGDGHSAALGVLVRLALVERQDMGLDPILLSQVLPCHQGLGFGLGQLGGV